MSDINEVRKRLERACIAGMDAEYVDDVVALLDDHARLQQESAAALSALKDACAMHLLFLSGQNPGGTVEMVGSHNMQAAAWRLRHTCELPLDQSHVQMMAKLRKALTLAFGEAPDQREGEVQAERFPDGTH